jgi:hypothetical protein
MVLIMLFKLHVNIDRIKINKTNLSVFNQTTDIFFFKM